MSHAMNLTALGTLLLTLVAGCDRDSHQPAPVIQPADLVVTGVRWYDGTGGGPFEGDLVIRDGRFAAMGPGTAERYEATRRIDGNGAYAVPGLWDLHVHLRSSDDDGLDAAAFLAHGVTSVRDLGSVGHRLGELIEGDAARPTIYPSYEILNGESFGPFQRVVTTEAGVRAAIDELAERGASQVKIHRAFPPALLHTAVEAAKAHGLPVVGHIPLGMHPLEACEAGMAGLEHMASIIEAWASVTPDADNAKATAWLTTTDADPLIDCLRQRGVTVTPTLHLYTAIGQQRFGDADTWPPEARQMLADLDAGVRRLHEAGVRLLAGSDISDLGMLAGLEPGGSLIGELEALQSAGLPPQALIPAATGNAAAAVGRGEKAGVIAQGADADLVLLRQDPGEDIAHLRTAVSVIRAGRVAWE